MAANLKENQGEETAVGGTKEQRGPGRRQRIGRYGVVAALLVALLIGSMAIHDRQASHPTVPVMPQTYVSTMPPLLSAYCDATAIGSPGCFFPQPEHGVELEAVQQADGTWQVVARFEMPVDDGR